MAATNAKVAGDDHWLPLRFDDIGSVRADYLLKAIATHDIYTTEVVSSAIARTQSQETAEMLKAWEEILELKRAQSDEETAEYERPTEKMDTLAVFGGPTHAFELVCSENDVKAMPNFDKVADPSFDILNDLQFAMLMVAVLVGQPLTSCFAPECTAYSRAQNFNRNRPAVQIKIAARRATQEKVMRRVCCVLRAILVLRGARNI